MTQFVIKIRRNVLLLYILSYLYYYINIKQIKQYVIKININGYTIIKYNITFVKL
jgi:hypothetical protein